MLLPPPLRGDILDQAHRSHKTAVIGIDPVIDGPDRYDPVAVTLR